MDLAPAEIRKWLQQKGLILSDVRGIIRDAASCGRIDVLEWLHKHTPGGVTAEDYRSENNFALRLAAHYEHIAVLDWLHQHIPGGVTAEDCRSDNNFALRLAACNGHVAVLDWLHKCIPGGFTAEDCRSNNNDALRWAAYYGCMDALEWLAAKLTLAEFAEFKRENVWLQVRKKSMLALVVAGKRRKIRLPPELWNLVQQWY